MISPETLELLVDDVARELAQRVRAELGDLFAGLEVREPWCLLDLDEASARLGRSPTWLRKKAKAGEIPHVRLDGGALAFELADLQAFAVARRVDASAGVLAARLHGVGDPAHGAGSRGERQRARLRVRP